MPSFELLIQYYDTQGHIMFHPFIDQLSYRQPYTIHSPEIEGYKCSRPVVTGTMPARNVKINVYYTKEAPKVDIPEPEEPIL